MEFNQFVSSWRLTVRLLYLVAALTLLPYPVLAGDISQAQEMVEQTTNQVLETLKQNKQRLENDKKALYGMVDAIILPHFDFRVMSRLVLGKHWKTATPDQQKRFTEEFKTLLVRTYSTAMLDFTEQQVKYLPIRANGEDSSKALSRMEISQPGGGRPAQMQLRMIDRDGSWMIYDVTIDGISLVTNYRNSFSNEIVQNGVEHLIEQLADKNRNQPG